MIDESIAVTPEEIQKRKDELLDNGHEQPSLSSLDIKSYIDSHPGAIKGLFSGYTQDIESLLDSAGPARSLVEGSIKDKCPWLWDAVYGEPDSDLEPPSKSNGNRRRVLDPEPENDEDYDNQNTVNEEDWREAIEYAIELRRLRIPPSSIADKILEHYDIDIDPRQITKLISNYLLDQKADRYVSETSYKPQIRTRTNDSILLKVSSLMADKKGLIAEINGLQSKLDLLQNPSNTKVGLIRNIWRKLW